MQRKRIAVYTAIFGDKDDFRPLPAGDDYDLWLFTDAALSHPDYSVVRSPRQHVDPTRDARQHKIMAHEVLAAYESSLWLDANIAFEGVDPAGLLEGYLEDVDLALHGHPERDCIYEEARVCIDIHKDSAPVIRRQMARYREQGYPTRHGLVSTGILYRRHSAAVAAFNQAWWNEVDRHSRRDQLSFNYVAWNTSFRYRAIPGHVRFGGVPGFFIGPHRIEASFGCGPDHPVRSDPHRG